MKRILSILLVAGLAACGEGTDGQPTGGDGPVADLEVTVDHPDRDVMMYQLSCQRDTATLTGDEVGIDASAACAALSEPEAIARLVEGPPQNQICTEIYGGPDTADVVGTIDGQPVDTQIDRADGCGIHDWDDILGDVLPAAVGVTD